MMFYPSFYPSPYYRRARNYPNSQGLYNINNSSSVNNASFNKNIDSSIQKEEPKKEEDRKCSGSETDTDTEYFEIFGLKLYFDDVLLICMVFFLYNEGVEDQMLFISLILLLLS